MMTNRTPLSPALRAIALSNYFVTGVQILRIEAHAEKLSRQARDLELVAQHATATFGRFARDCQQWRATDRLRRQHKAKGRGKNWRVVG